MTTSGQLRVTQWKGLGMYGDNRDIFWKVVTPTKENTRLLRDSIDFVAKKYPPPMSILDVGCKEGYSTSYWKKLGYDVLGTDIRDNFIEYGQRMGWPVIFDDMVNTKIRNKYDLVFLRHCLEHVKHDNAMFRNAVSCLNLNGIIVVQVPIETKSQFEAHQRAKHLTYFKSLNNFRTDFLNGHLEVETIMCDMASNFGIDTAGMKDIFYIGQKK